jgi:hypothetical protein
MYLARRSPARAASLIFLIIALVSVGLTVRATAAGARPADTGSTVKTQRGTDYLAAPADEARVVAANEGQCSKPLAERAGGWSCRTAPVAAVTGYCNASGCYKRYDDFHVDWATVGSFTYGYGGSVVGSGNAYMNWQLAGPNTTSYPARVKLSSSTTDMVGSISLLNGAQNTTGGSLLKGPYICCSPEWNRPHGPNITYAWPADRKIITRDDTAWDNNSVVEFSWTVPGYPGYWFMWVRSVVSHTTLRNSGGNSIYRFGPVNNETQAPHAEGWRA